MDKASHSSCTVAKHNADHNNNNAYLNIINAESLPAISFQYHSNLSVRIRLRIEASLTEGKSREGGWGIWEPTSVLTA